MFAHQSKGKQHVLLEHQISANMSKQEVEIREHDGMQSNSRANQNSRVTLM